MSIKALLMLLVIPIWAQAFFWGGDGDHVGNGGGLAELTIVKSYADLQSLRPLCLRSENVCQLSVSEKQLLADARLDWKVFFSKSAGSPVFEARGDQLFFSSAHLYEKGWPLPMNQLIPLAMRAFFSRESEEEIRSLREKLSFVLLQDPPQETIFRSYRFYFSPRTLVNDFFVLERVENSVDLAAEMAKKLCGSNATVHLSQPVFRERTFGRIEVVGNVQAECERDRITAKFQLTVNEESISFDFWNIKKL